MANLFRSGEFTLSGGATSSWKIDCDALTQEDWSTLAVLVAALRGPFSSVVGVPRGGLALAAALQEHRTPGVCRLLIVDDVLTTGRSMELLRSVRSEPDVVGAVVFARGPCPPWVTPLFRTDVS